MQKKWGRLSTFIKKSPQNGEVCWLGQAKIRAVNKVLQVGACKNV